MTASVAANRSGSSGWVSERGGAGWLPALTYSAGVYLVIRIALFLLSAAAWGLATEHPSVTPAGTFPTDTNGWHNVITGWNKQDANWFLMIARDGYSDQNGSAAFYPAYPVLIRMVGYLCLGHQLVAAYIVSNAALLAALVILYRLTEREFDTAFARRTVLYLAVFPTAFFLFDTYSEALFLLAAVGAFYLARTRRWGWAGLVGILATLTRSMGVVVVLALAAEAIHQAVEEHRDSQQPGASHEHGAGYEHGAGLGHSASQQHRASQTPGAGQQHGAGHEPSAGQVSVPSRLGLPARTALRLAASALPLAGIAGYLLFWQLRFHDWSRPFRLESAIWGRQFTLPWVTFWRGLSDAWTLGPVGNDAWWMLDFVLVAAGLLLAVWVAVRARPIYAVYTWASIVLFLAESVPGRPLASDPRYLVTIFPLAWALAWLGRRPARHDAVVGLSAASLGLVAWLFLVTTNVF